jgi:hypothetical protein
MRSNVPFAPSRAFGRAAFVDDGRCRRECDAIKTDYVAVTHEFDLDSRPAEAPPIRWCLEFR